MTSPTWMRHVSLVTPDRTYRGEEALQEYDCRQPRLRHIAPEPAVQEGS